MKIMFFMEGIQGGGKERRAVELFHYLKQNTDIEFVIVLTEEEIHYDYLLELKIPIIILKRRFFKKDPLLIFKFFIEVNKFKPDIIHVWGAMTCFYSVFSARYFKIPIINSQIADANTKELRTKFGSLITRFNFSSSRILLSNSMAGLDAYSANIKKSAVIYNGIRLDRFNNLKSKKTIKEDFKIRTPISVVMVGGLNRRKDFNLYVSVANKICKMRSDVTFIAVGDGEARNDLESRVLKLNLNRFLFTGEISNVEELVNSCDIGVLLSKNSTHIEGIPNAIMEYMALSKPVIATNNGGTIELVEDNVSGYLLENKLDHIIEKINKLLNNKKLRMEMGRKGRRIIESQFNIDKMGNEFVKTYSQVLKGKED